MSHACETVYDEIIKLVSAEGGYWSMNVIIYYIIGLAQFIFHVTVPNITLAHRFQNGCLEQVEYFIVEWR